MSSWDNGVRDKPSPLRVRLAQDSIGSTLLDVIYDQCINTHTYTHIFTIYARIKRIQKKIIQSPIYYSKF